MLSETDAQHQLMVYSRLKGIALGRLETDAEEEYSKAISDEMLIDLFSKADAPQRLRAYANLTKKRICDVYEEAKNSYAMTRHNEEIISTLSCGDVRRLEAYAELKDRDLADVRDEAVDEFLKKRGY